MPDVTFEKTKEENIDFRRFIVVDTQGQTHKIKIDKIGGYTVNLPVGESRLYYILTGRTKGYIDVDRTQSGAKAVSDRYQIRSGHTLAASRLFMVT